MHAGALRALEFDRIVEVIRGFAQTPQGEAHLAALQPATEPRAVASALAATSETVSFLAGNQIAVQAPHELEVILAGVTVEGRPLEPLQLSPWPISCRRSTPPARRSGGRARPRSPYSSPSPNGPPRSITEIADVRRKIDPAGRCGRRCLAGVEAASATGCGGSGRGCAARWSRTCAARTRRNICSSRSSPTGMAGTCWWSAPNTAARSRASFMAARAAAPASISSRSAPSRSTTTSLRWSSRNTKRCGASCWPSPMRSAAAPRISIARWMLPPGSTS